MNNNATFFKIILSKSTCANAKIYNVLRSGKSPAISKRELFQNATATKRIIKLDESEFTQKNKMSRLLYHE